MTTERVIDKRIPDKWRDYEPCGVPIRGERIIAFKTPLSNRYDNESDLDNGIKPFERFTPMDLLNHINQKDMNLGMVIDFTNTNRYYSGQEFCDHGILYRKIKCVGKEIPSDDVVRRFKAEVCSFMANNSTGALVGVHCTHGLNRAGYIVCRYLIECRAYTPEKAIKAFNEARGYPMERDNYLQDLKTKTPKVDDFSSLKAKRKDRKTKKRRRDIPSERPRYVHTSTESFPRHVSSGQDNERMGRGPPQYNRRQNEHSDFESRYRNEDRDRFTDYNTQTRNYTSRMFSKRGRRDNHCDDDNTYDHYDNAYHNDDYRYGNYDNRYNNSNNYASYDYQDYRPSSRERSYRPDHVMRDKPYSSRNRSKPYSHQRTRH